MTNKVVIAGVGMIPFKKPGQSDSYDQMGSKATRAALADAGLDYQKIQQAYASYVYGDSCAGQAALYNLGITGVPIVNVNNNCASGSTAFALASQAVASGAVDCALAMGFEQMMPGALDMVFPDRISPLHRHNQATAELLGLSEEEQKLPPAVMLFGCQVELAKETYGLSDSALAQISIKARRHAQHNSNAIFRSPLTEDDILADEPIYRGLRKLYACPPSCGAAAVIVCNESFARRHGVRSDIRLIGSGWCSDKQEYFESDPLDIMFRALSREAANQAYEEAGIGPEAIDVIELHDCFTSNEAITYEALGLCRDDEVEKFILEKQNTYGGRYVIGPSGGLLAKGHPLGATGLAQITELVEQLRGQSGVRQVQGARTALQHNGGLGSAGFVNIIQRQR
ncbi:lipid-transfer protein [Pseudomaricurvus alkylphenolicus]|uniref:thiolase C-terminal domain-containing protein n=1 Tax=Pseudomaricurvus alkylphenolicus TaxID=1306991 RepID=UPI001422FDA1|nr:lipid-transfer protein [Pseudomaricurvus alkylphenolicus]NIB41664.1 lipid-transfer protein [Pseudomaricurvus alkylphenolicus]